MASYRLEVNPDDGVSIKTGADNCKDETTFALYMLSSFAEVPKPASEPQPVATFRQQVRQFLDACAAYRAIVEPIPAKVRRSRHAD